MEFISNYGLFLAKVVTIVIAIGVIISFVVSASTRGQHRQKGRIVVTPLNDRFEEMADRIRDVMLDQKALKKLDKDRKKREKAERKAQQANTGENRKKRVFVLDFEGDVKASATEDLRESITAVLSFAEPRDEVVVRLESQGGMVHSYGLAASQLKRITDRSIPLTVCVDKVAASGGYMMACVGDRILAAPFAVIGSIGVVAQLPNFHKVLQKNDIDYELLTAGEYKRTLTMFGENTDKGRQKFMQDLEDIHLLFKDFIRENRETLDVESVATGEVWFGRRAHAMNLVDELITSDEYLTSQFPEADIVAVTYEHKKTLPEKVGMAASAALEKTALRLLAQLNMRYWAG